jgi:hypothetical protein
MDTVYNVLVKRLEEFYPLDHIANILGQESIPDGLDWEFGPLDTYYETMSTQRESREYHQGRIQWFILNGVPDPIEIDNHVTGRYIYPTPIVEDGHHRLAAAIIRGDETIPAVYGGRIDLLDWLTGRSDKLPEE